MNEFFRWLAEDWKKELSTKVDFYDIVDKEHEEEKGRIAQEPYKYEIKHG